MAGLALAAGVLLAGMTAQAESAGQGAAALALAPRAPTAQALLGEQDLVDGNVDAARSLARAALARSPMDVRALRTYGLAVERQGDAAQAADAMRLAAALGWRDSPTQLWLLKAAMLRGDFVTAAEQADAMLRRRELDGQMHLAIRALASVPAGAVAVAERLEQAPAWRIGFFQDVFGITPAGYSAQEALFERLRGGAAPLVTAEVAPYVAVLAGRGEYDRARRAWLRWGVAGNAGAALQNGDFTGVADGDADDTSNIVFGWSLQEGVGGSIKGDDGFVPGTHAIRVDTDGTVSRPLLRQTVLLSPGRHRFDVAEAGSAPAAERAVHWSLRCVGHEDDVPATTEPARRTGRWTRRTIGFDVPADCAAQVLTLAAVSLDRPEQLSLWFANAALR